MNILGLFPLTGNGGIASWTKKFINTFPNDDYVFTYVNVSPKKQRRGFFAIPFVRLLTGCVDFIRIIIDVRKALKECHYDILHTTTSGNVGSFRDYFVFKLCHWYHVKTIMHCRYGCITEDIYSSGIVSKALRKAMDETDQIWVLDSRSYATLKSINNYKDKVFLTPNSIEISQPIDTTPKEYKEIAFCGNLIPSKGLYELVEAVISTNAVLHVIGPGLIQVIDRVKQIAGEEYNKRVFLHGRLPNAEAVAFLKSVDIVALPTYYPSEAFPISIIEAMSLSKMLISCPHAAIPDMLTDLDGNFCGLLVEKKSPMAIADAINWCQTHSHEADIMCQKAYEKVKTCYSTDVVYDLYRTLYDKLLKNNN